MGCNCRKPKKPVANSSDKVEKSSAAKVRESQAARKATSYALAVPGRRTQMFGSRLEADAANARLGRIGRVRQV